MAEAKPIQNVIKMPYWELVPMVDIEQPTVYNRVLESVKEKGILYPLVVVKISREAWLYEKASRNPDILDPPDYLDICYRIQCGNNRYRAGLELGITEFDCILLEDLQAAKEMCSKQRKGDKEW